MNRELYHARKYHNEFQTPSVFVDGIGNMFVQDFVILDHSIGNVMGKILRYFKKVSCKIQVTCNYYNKIHVHVPFIIISIMYSAGTTHLVDGGLIKQLSTRQLC